MDMKTKQSTFKAYLWTLAYFIPYIKQTLLYILCGGLMIWGQMIIPQKIGYIIDNILPMNKMMLLYKEMLILLGVVVLILVFKSFYTLLEQIISNNIMRDQQVDLIKKLYSLGFSYYEKVPSGQILSLFENAVKETQKTYNFLFPHLIYSMAQFLVPAIILVMGQPLLFLASLIGNIMYVFLNHTTNKRIQHFQDLETKAAHKSQQSLYDTLVAKSELKLFGSQEWIIGKTMSDFEAYRKPRMKAILWRHIRFTIVGLTLTVSMIFFYYFGMNLIKSGQILFGEFIGYSFLMALLSRGFSVFFYIIPAQLHALNYAKQLKDFHELKAQVKPSNKNDISIKSYDITFNNVSFSYDDKAIIKNLSLSISSGKKTAIVGESGCGKSTLLKLINRFYDVDSGELLIGGYNIKSFNQDDLRALISNMFQETYLFNLSVLDNIKFANLHASDLEVMNVCKQVDAHDFITETERGYQTMVGEKGIGFSGGQKQRLSIARVILKDSPILLFDEATSALDKKSEAGIKKAIETLSKKTIVSVAHRLSTIKDYDHIILMDKGDVYEQGTYEDLIAKQGMFYKMVMKGESDDR